MMHITEDTPPDMLAGAMDLTVHLPNGRSVKMSVERSTPMMDLLVQIVTAHQLQLSGHILEALEMAPAAGISDRVLPYKPNTPIGALDTQHIRVVPKNRNLSGAKAIPSGHQPFESTFRLKVHLPRNQLYVTRVSQNVYLEDIMSKVCKEKNLDPVKYEFRHPGNLDEVLDPKLTLSDYQITEIYVVSKGSGRLTQAFSTSDIMALRKEEERKQFQAKTGGGVFNLIFKRGKSNLGNGSISSENRSISPTQSDDSGSVTPPGLQPAPPLIKEPPAERPKPPQRKRRPAPKPPQASTAGAAIEKPASQISNNSQNSETSAKRPDNGLLICHSRNSSDSSGYHEASILSDNCNTSLPRRPKTMIENDEANVSKLSGEHSRSTGNLTKTAVQYKSTSSLALHSRKKKTAPPPPPKAASQPETPNIKPEIASPVVASQPVETPAESVATIPTNQIPSESIVSSTVPASIEISEPPSTRTSLSNKEIGSELLNVHPPTPPPTPQRTSATTEEIRQTAAELNITLAENKNEADSGICEKEDLELETVWRYQLPSPPKAFRDASPVVQTVSQFDTETLPDSVVTNPELFEKLQYVKDIQDAESDIPSVVSEDDKEICNKLTLEHLEKRKSLVYNRELATSLKFAQENDSPERSGDKPFDIIKSEVIHELEDAITNNGNDNATKSNATNTKAQDNFKSVTLDKNLPNFQISSYDTKKEKINIFEDDTIRSNVARSNSILKTNVAKKETITSDSDKPENLTKNVILERVSKRSNSVPEACTKRSEDMFKKPQDLVSYRRKLYDRNNRETNINNNPVSRSESFSINSEMWTPSNPVKRSKSQIALNKYKDDNMKNNTSEGLSRCNSLLDVSSSLQSLEVMKKIQNKLSSSKEELDTKANQPPISEADRPITEENPAVKSSPVTHTTVSWSPPSINLGTWSQRPKTQVVVKEDTDYKFSTKVNTSAVNRHEEDEIKKPSSLKATSSFNFANKPNNININTSQIVTNGVSIKINGSEAISSQKTGNVVIKIGGSESNKEHDHEANRFANHINSDIYRKPLANVNKIDRAIRPHSIAFDNEFDVSRVPVVRSVELKKPFKDLQNNKSITQIYSNNINMNEDEPKSLNYSVNNYDNEDKIESKHTNVYLNNDESVSKPVFRNNSFTPIVKGFKSDGNTQTYRKLWNAYGTLPAKNVDNETELNTNRNVPFSQMNLRRTESNKVFNNNGKTQNNNGNIFGNVVLRNNNNFKSVIKANSVNNVDGNTTNGCPPPPPQLPRENASHRFTIATDARAELLSAIRDFGGKTGLRASKG